MLPHKLHLSDKELFTVNLFSAFVNNNYIKTNRIDWNYFWNDGINKAEAIGIHYTVVSPMLMMLIINGFNGSEIEFTNWFLKNFDRRRFFKGLVTLKDGIKLTKFFNNIELTENEKQDFNKFII